MRGKQNGGDSAKVKIGITPADAGKTVLHMNARPKFQDHPRGCGENATGINVGCKVLGSPPRMRGKH